MKRRKRRKFFIIVVLSFSLCMGFFSSYAAVTDDDASVVFKHVPISMKGWISYSNSLGIVNYNFSDSYFNYTMQSGNNSYDWRATCNFDDYSVLVPERLHTVIAWTYDSTLDFAVDYVYQFNVVLRYTNPANTSLEGIDFSKVLIGFGFDQSLYNSHSLSYSQVNSMFPALYSPSSYTVTNDFTVVLTYNIGIFPTSAFSGSYIDVDNGVSYVPVYYMG